VQQEPNRGGLPGAVRTEKAENLAAFDAQVKTVERDEVSEAL
jgi:hypothetical protein